MRICTIIAIACGLSSCSSPARAPDLPDARDAHDKTFSMTVTNHAHTGHIASPQQAGDFDGDGYDDFIVVLSKGSATPYTYSMEVWRGSSAGLPTSGATFTPTGYTIDTLEPVHGVGDFDNDGYDDVLIVDDTGDLHAHHGSSSGLLTKPTRSFGEQPRSLDVYDWDDDGYDDLWVVWESDDYEIERFEGSSSGLGLSAAEVLSPGAGFTKQRTTKKVAAGDFDDDGDPELVVLGIYTNAVMGGEDGDGLLRLEQSSSGAWSVGRTWDYTDVSLDYGGGLGVCSTKQVTAMGNHIRGVAAGGGDVVFVARYVDSVAFGSRACSVHSGYANEESWGDTSIPARYTIGGRAADLDGDGTDEIAYNSSGSVIYLVQGVFHLATATGTPVPGRGFPGWPGDFDGDGVDELVGGGPWVTYTQWVGLFDKDEDGFTGDVDCDDTDSDIYPGAPDAWYDGVDSDCAGNSDYDRDDDGFDSDGYGGADCDDRDPKIRPSADELAGDEIDQNCDGREFCFSDIDADGFRDATDKRLLSSDLDCTDPREARSSMSSGDCDDRDAATHPGAEELPGDEKDQDCDGGEICFVDADEDGWRTLVVVMSTDVDCSDWGESPATEPVGDCDDTDTWIYPGARDTWYDGVDSDCDGASDFDQDRDGADSSAYGGPDCDDLSAAIGPAALELPGDELDQDCDGTELCFVDADGDGYRETMGPTVVSRDVDCTDVGEARAVDPDGDCEDSNATAYPGATEVVGDEIDQSCDGTEVCFVDGDADGYRTGSTLASTDVDCSDIGEASVTAPQGDCDDGDATIFPGATEVIGDEVDQSCDGAESCYADLDADGWRTGTTVASTDVDCTDAGEALATAPGIDCDDDRSDTYPGATEVADDGIDQDCDGSDLVSPPSSGCATVSGTALMGSGWLAVFVVLARRRVKIAPHACSPS